MRLRRNLLFVLAALLGSWLVPVATVAADPAVLTYPMRPDSPRWNYALGLIALALKESGRDTALKPTAEEMSQARAARELELGDVERELMIVYPFTSFFFVNKANTRLAEDLENGLKKAYADGSFMAYFKNHPAIKAIFDQAHIDQRRRFDIPNPLLTEATRSIPAEYWQGQ
jgi:hypothetical protein